MPVVSDASHISSASLMKLLGVCGTSSDSNSLDICISSPMAGEL